MEADTSFPKASNFAIFSIFFRLSQKKKIPSPNPLKPSPVFAHGDLPIPPPRAALGQFPFLSEEPLPCTQCDYSYVCLSEAGVVSEGDSQSAFTPYWRSQGGGGRLGGIISISVIGRTK